MGIVKSVNDWKVKSIDLSSVLPVVISPNDVVALLEGLEEKDAMAIVCEYICGTRQRMDAMQSYLDE